MLVTTKYQVDAIDEHCNLRPCSGEFEEIVNGHKTYFQPKGNENAIKNHIIELINALIGLVDKMEIA